MQEILKYIGNWGKYQLYVYSLSLLPAMLSCCIAMLTVFSAAVPNVRCKLPGFDNENYSYYQKPFDLNLTEYLYPPPSKASGALMYCSYCDPNSISNKSKCHEKEALTCSEYIYDKSQFHSTLVSLFGMVCGNLYRRQLLITMYVVGIFFGTSIFGTIGDRYGRRKSFMIAAVLQIIILNSFPFAFNYFLFCALQICIGAAQAGTFLSSFTVVMELFGGLPKTFFGIWIQGLYSLGYIYIGISAYLNRDWRHLTWTVAVLPFLYIPLVWLFPESIRWLVVNREYEKAKRLVEKAARWNNVVIPEAVLEKELKLTNTEVKRETALNLFRSREFTMVTLVVFFIWIVDSMSYYGLSWNTSSLPGNVYVNFILSGLSELPSYAICVPMMEYFGRRLSLTTFFGIGGFCIICSGFIKNTIAIITLSNLGKLCVAAAYAVTYNYTAELFPTTVRNQACGFSSAVARLGAMAAPQIVLLAKFVDNWLPQLIYGSFALAASVLVCLLPETKGLEMTETVQDGLAVIRKQRHKVADAVKQPQEAMPEPRKEMDPERNDSKF